MTSGAGRRGFLVFAAGLYSLLQATGLSGQALSLVPTALPGGSVGSPYVHTVTAAGGTPPYSVPSVTIGSVPPGTIFSVGTVIFNFTPAAAANFIFTISMTDSAAVSISQDYFIFILTPSSATATAGTPQSATVNTFFATPLQVHVATGGAIPVEGAQVTFSAPGSGASGTFSASNVVFTDAAGNATAPPFKANAIPGLYTVAAAVSGVAFSPAFTLTNLPGQADVTVSKSHTGSFVRGQELAQYNITVSNVGTLPTSGTVTLTDTLPAGLTATAIGGTGWACVLSTLTCTRSDALAVGSSYPVILLTVNVHDPAPSLVTNTATVSGGGDANATNNTATDPTTIVPCAAHTVHGHVSSSPPDGHNGNSHVHHGQHGHDLLPGTECLPSGHHVTIDGHFLGLTPESSGPDFLAILNQDGDSAPAPRGTIIQLFGSARGLFFDSADQEPVLRFTPPASGLPLYYTTSLPEVLIGGVPGEVLFSGLAPGLAGAWQINVRIPPGIPDGPTPVTILYEGQGLQALGVTVK